MIKVNLLKEGTAIKTGTSVSGGTVFGATMAGANVPADINKDVMGKIILLILPVLASYGFMYYQNNLLDQELGSLKAQSTQISTEVESLKPEIAAVNKFKEEQKRLEVQIETIKSISRERLKNVKALEKLQELIPEKAWLTSLKIEDLNVTIAGRAVDDKNIADFMRNLEESIFFSQTRLIKTTEEKTAGGALKAFEVGCALEGM